MSTPLGTILLAHGSRSTGQRDVVTELARRAQQVTGSPWRAAFLDHHGPTIAEAAADLAGHDVRRPVVVPTLLSQAFHAGVDVPAAVDSLDLATPPAIAEPLGLDPRLFDVVGRQLAQWCRDTGTLGSDVTLVVAAAGSSNPLARKRFIEFVEQAGHRAGAGSVTPAFIAGGDPDVSTTVERAALPGRPTVLAPFALADGIIVSRAGEEAARAGAATVLPPLGAADEVVSILVERRDACATV